MVLVGLHLLPMPFSSPSFSAPKMRPKFASVTGNSSNLLIHLSAFLEK